MSAFRSQFGVSSDNAVFELSVRYMHGNMRYISIGET